MIKHILHVCFSVLITFFSIDADAGWIAWSPLQLGQAAPGDIIEGGREQNPGRDLHICRAQHAGGLHPGKLIGGQCNIGYGGAGIEKPVYEVARGQGGAWGPPKPNLVGALVGGQEPGRILYVCRARHTESVGMGTIDRGVHPGKIVGNTCNIEFAGKEVPIGKFEVFYPHGDAPSLPAQAPSSPHTCSIKPMSNIGCPGAGVISAFDPGCTRTCDAGKPTPKCEPFKCSANRLDFSICYCP